MNYLNIESITSILALLLASLLFGVIRNVQKVKSGCFLRTHTGIFPQEIRAASDISDVSILLLAMILLNEDDLYYRHSGFNFPEIINALKYSISNRKLKGGSSITQQTYKLLFLKNKNRFIRKVGEFFGSLVMEIFLTKEEILSLYLQVCKFGPDLVGLESASLHYLNKLPRDITLAESIIFAQLLKRPRFTIKYVLGRDILKSMDFSLAFQKILDLLAILNSRRDGKTLSKGEVVKLIEDGVPISVFDESTQIKLNSIATLILDEVYGKLSKIVLPPIPTWVLTKNYFRNDEALIISKSIYVNKYNNRDSRILLDSLNEDEIIRFGQRHKIIQLIDPEDKVIKKFPLLIELYNQSRIVLVRNFLRKVDEFKEINSTLEQTAPFVLVKGLDLANRFYEDPWKRPFGDIDITVSKASFKEVVLKLIGKGYKIVGSDHAGAKLGNLIDHCIVYKESLLLRREFSEVDCHFVSDKDFDFMLNQSENLTISNIRYRGMPKYEYLKYLLNHLRKHNFHNLLWLHDIAKILSLCSEKELLKFNDQTLNTSTNRAFKLSIAMCYYFCALEIRDEISNKIFESDPCTKLLYLARLQISNTSVGLRRVVFNIRTQLAFEPAFKGKFRFLIIRIFKPTFRDISYIVLPSKLSFAYYLVRPARILHSLLKSFFKKVQRSI